MKDIKLKNHMDLVSAKRTKKVFDNFNWLGTAKGVTKYSCKKCQGIEVMGDFPNGSIWNLIKHKCKP